MSSAGLSENLPRGAGEGQCSPASSLFSEKWWEGLWSQDSGAWYERGDLGSVLILSPASRMSSVKEPHSMSYGFLISQMGLVVPALATS